MMSSRSVLVTGITGLGNRGVEALLVPTLGQLLRRLDADVKVLTRTPDYDQRRLGLARVSCLRDEVFFQGIPRLSTWRRARRRVGRLLGRRHTPSPIDDAIRNAMLVVAAGGDIFSSDYGDMPLHLLPLRKAQEHGVPVVFLAQSIGPFRTPKEAADLVAVARRAALITVRESRTYAYLTRELGLSEQQVHLTADPAFLLSPVEPEMVRSLWKYYGLDEHIPVVALSISSGISQFSGVNSAAHADTWLAVIQSFLRETPAQVALIPHVQSTELDDRVAQTELLRRLQFESRVRLIGGDHTAAELKGIISRCSMVVAERMHAAVAGLSSGVPTVAISYSVKAEGIVGDLLGFVSDRDERLVIPIGDLVGKPAVAARLLDVWHDRDTIRDRLGRALPSMVARATRTFDLVEQVVSTSGPR